jgi:hypothetical protein
MQLRKQMNVSTMAVERRLASLFADASLAGSNEPIRWPKQTAAIAAWRINKKPTSGNQSSVSTSDRTSSALIEFATGNVPRVQILKLDFQQRKWLKKSAKKPTTYIPWCI